MGLFFGMSQLKAMSSTLWNDLQSYWALNQTAGVTVPDAVSNKPGTTTSVTWTATGKKGYCAGINTTTSHISMGNNFNYDRLQAWTYSCWIKRTSIGTTSMIVSKYGSANNSMFIFFPTNNRIQISMINTSGTNSIVVETSTTFTDTSDWHLYTITYDGSSNASGIKIFYDSVLQSMNSPVYNNLTGTILNTYNFEIGSRNNSSIGLLGLLDEFGVWNRALTQAEVTELYNGGAGRFYGETLWDNLLSYWRFNETTGTSVADAIGGVTGTIKGNIVTYSWVAGKSNNALQTSVVQTAIGFGNNFAFERNQPFSISIWHKRTVTGANAFLFSKSFSYNLGYEALFGTDNKLTFHITNTSTSNEAKVISTATYTNTTAWHLYTFTYDGSSSTSGMKIYYDGALVTTTSSVNNLSATIVDTGEFVIGNRLNTLGEGNYGRGVFDESAIWSRVLTQTDITNIYNGGSGLFY